MKIRIIAVCVLILLAIASCATRKHCDAYGSVQTKNETESI